MAFIVSISSLILGGIGQITTNPIPKREVLSKILSKDEPYPSHWENSSSSGHRRVNESPTRLVPSLSIECRMGWCWVAGLVRRRRVARLMPMMVSGPKP